VHTFSTKPSLRLTIAIFVALLILFAWLHLILALQVASTERQIQSAAAEIRKLERDQVALQHKIAESMSPAEMQGRLLEQGFRRSAPVYVLMPQPATEEQGGAVRGVASIAPTISEPDLPGPEVQSMLESVLTRFDTLAQKGLTP
jgi:hypothetical protein